VPTALKLKAASSFAVPGSILDGMAPHVWQGPTATQDWYRDVLVEGKQHGASDYFVTVGQPLHNNVTVGSAYVVVPASSAVFTVALRKLPAGWRIAAWAWTVLPWRFRLSFARPTNLINQCALGEKSFALTSRRMSLLEKSGIGSRSALYFFENLDVARPVMQLRAVSCGLG